MSAVNTKTYIKGAYNFLQGTCADGTQNTNFIEDRVKGLVADKLSEEKDEKQKNKHAILDKHYYQHIGDREGGIKAYYGVLSEMIHHAGPDTPMVHCIVGATGGVETLINAYSNIPKQIRKTIDAFDQPFTGKKIEATLGLTESCTGVVMAGSKILKATMDVSKAERVSSTGKALTKSVGFASKIASGVFFIFYAASRMYSLYNVYNARKEFTKILNDESYTPIQRRSKALLYLTNKIRVSKENEKKTIDAVKVELEEKFLKENPKASSKEIEEYVLKNIENAVLAKLEDLHQTMYEDFTKTFGKKAMDLLVEFPEEVDDKVFTEKADEIIKTAKSGLSRQAIIHSLIIIGSTLAFAGSIVASISTAGIYNLVSLVLTVISTTIWVGFDTYQFVNEIRAGKLSKFEIFKKTVNFVFFTAALCVAQFVQEQTKSLVILGYLALIWLLTMVYTNYRENHKKEEKEGLSLAEKIMKKLYKDERLKRCFSA